MTYGMLLTPHQNKRYFDAIKTLSLSELQIMTDHFENKIANLRYESVGGMELLLFDSEELTEREKKVLYIHSALFVLFEVMGQGCLKPIMEGKRVYFKEDISSILKYKGKTNESFTDLMINVGIFSSDFAKDFDSPLTVLDPMCGKGTTLFQALVKGYHSAGVEITQAFLGEFESFMKRYFQFHHYKYESENASFSKDGRKIGRKITFETADSAQNFKLKDRRTIHYIQGDTSDTCFFFGKEKFHTIITDLPYGVQHDSTQSGGYIKLESLLSKAVGGWAATLKKGGALVIAYNNFTLKRDSVAKIVSGKGLTVMEGNPYDRFEHWVEQAVNRDILVAKK